MVFKPQVQKNKSCDFQIIFLFLDFKTFGNHVSGPTETYQTFADGRIHVLTKLKFRVSALRNFWILAIWDIYLAVTIHSLHSLS